MRKKHHSIESCLSHVTGVPVLSEPQQIEEVHSKKQRMPGSVTLLKKTKPRVTFARSQTCTSESTICTSAQFCQICGDCSLSQRHDKRYSPASMLLGTVTLSTMLYGRPSIPTVLVWLPCTSSKNVPR